MKKNTEATIRKMLVDPGLASVGWKDSDILVEPAIQSESGILRPDYILSIDAYPVAIIEVKSSVENLDEFKSQLIRYRDAVGVSLAIGVLGSKIFRLNVNKGSLDEEESLPSREYLSKNLNVGESEYPNIRHVFQMLAISAVFKSIDSGSKRISVRMVQGSGKSLTILKIITKILVHNPSSKIIVAFDRSETRKFFSNSLAKLGINCVSTSQVDQNSFSSKALSSARYFSPVLFRRL